MTSTNKVDISKALLMSLDDYVRESGLYISPVIKAQKQNITYQQNSKFDRREEDMDEDEEDLLQIDTNEDLLKEIKTEETADMTANNTFDLRSRINGQKNVENPINTSNNLSKIPKANSQQWRLMHPNNTHNRPPGMPPLIQNDADLNVYNVTPRKNVTNNNYIADCDNIYRNNINGNRNNNNNYNNFNNNNRNRNYTRNRPYNNNYIKNQVRNNFRNNNNHKRNQMNNNNMNETVYHQPFQNNNQQFRMIDGTIPNDITIKVNSSTMIANNSEKSLPSLMSIPLPQIDTPQTIPITLNSADNNAQNCVNNYRNKNTSLIPFDNSGNLELTQLSSIAATLLDTLRKGILPEEKPKYDMKLQKEIHSIQRKPMIYKCPSGEVISSDGPGLDLGLKPTTTGISLNQRFA